MVNGQKLGVSATSANGNDGLRSPEGVKNESPWAGNEHLEKSALQHSAVSEVSNETKHLSRRVSFQAHDVAPPEAEHSCGFSNLKKAHAVSMKKIVDILYHKVLSDQRLNVFYEGVDMAKLKSQQEKLMMLVFGGNDLLQMEGATMDLRAIHMRLLIHGGLAIQHFDVFVQHFEETLEEVGDIPENSKLEAIAMLKSTAPMFHPATASEVEAYNAAHPVGAAH
eukprot:CAMPEP_0202890188 /NCGR_PEP_ID=MMETSP1392-20130828/682_1 /ASSEMBLY_ACC=CAM_ASM_000868 /TAXON_ID=225041 /ORGANISM="Chlamydomonas chlamydogama, Strain SAG 11-48b" /LENGTH=222 /DNA_ID=CAMNT_0049573719 /DNA_START=294 /DNA_END=962 /DNA_ORIENTATION=+